MTLVVKNLDLPDETRPFQDKGRMNVVVLDTIVLGRAVFEPGWRWSEHVKPLVGTESCEVDHAGYVLSGRMRVRMDSGEEAEIGSGDAFSVSAGHDAWIVGDEPCVILDFAGTAHYAEPSDA